MFENSQNVRKDMNLYSQEAQQTPGKINMHTIIKLWEAKNKDRILKEKATCHMQEIFNKINRKFLIRNHRDHKGVRCHF